MSNAKSSLRLYAPFLLLALVQAIFVVAAPSNRPQGSEQQLATGGQFTGDGGTVFDESGQPVSTDGGGVGGASGGVGGGGGTGGGTAGVEGGGGGTGGGGGGGVASAGDTSHCVGDRQFDILINDPVCKPAWPKGADNGCNTWQGVTCDEILVVGFSSEANAAVNAVLAPQGLAASEQELNDLYEAAFEFVHANYELYGRKIKFVRIEGDCPTTPPDPAKCKEAAREVIKMKPFMVVWGTPLYAEVFHEWTRAGIVAIGGWHFDAKEFTNFRPYRYDAFMDGTQSAEHLGNYFCRKMANKNASHSGRSIHPTIGLRNQVKRKLGIVIPELEANVSTARHLQSIVDKCQGGDKARKPIIVPYESNIETAQEQTDATTQKMIREKVTTVVCMCDPIAPAFGSAGFTQQGFFPEFLMPGLGLLDYDLLGRLYEKQQMQHAFGVGHLQEPIAFEQQDQSRMWRATGRSGTPCKSCGLPWAYVALVAGFFHSAGPNLTPLNLEAAVLNGESYGGDKPGTVLIDFGPGDYTAISDAREIYWSATTRSKIDGQPGAYISPNNAKRYRSTEWNKTIDYIPVSPS